jgi:hypothetical protein
LLRLPPSRGDIRTTSRGQLSVLLFLEVFGLLVAGRMIEERGLLILGQQEHEQLLDDEIAHLKSLLQTKEAELQDARAALKAAVGRPSHSSQLTELGIVGRLESLEQEIVQLKRRTPTLYAAACAAGACNSLPTLSQGRELLQSRFTPRQHRRCCCCCCRRCCFCMRVRMPHHQFAMS